MASAERNVRVPSKSSPSRRLGVLGIGLVMEEVGKGARLVFRYPASPPPIFLSSSPPSSSHPSSVDGGAPELIDDEAHGRQQHQQQQSSKMSERRHSHGIIVINNNGNNNNNNNNNNNAQATTSEKKKSRGNGGGGGERDPTSAMVGGADGGGGGGGGGIDLFFDLPARVVSKLFRPKRPLCGQPLSLRIGGTTFCCRAELFDSHHHHHHHHHHPTTVGEGWGGSSEEMRCGYVSRQCGMLLRMRREYEVGVGRDIVGLPAGCGDGAGAANLLGGTSEAAGPKKGDNNGIPGPPPTQSPREKGAATPPPPSSSGAANAKEFKSRSTSSVLTDDEVDPPAMTRTRRREYVQDLIDIMLAATPPPVDDRRRIDDDFEGRDQHGNLARELASVFHCLSSTSTSNASLLSRSTASGGVVYVNRHIAVEIESVHDDSSRPTRQRGAAEDVRPYQTLLFPVSSPSEVLECLTDETHGCANDTTASHSTSQSLRRVLPHVHPRKSLHEVAWDSGLSLPRVVDVANWLVHSGTCVAAMPVLLKNRYACAGGVVTRMAHLALPFWQAFGIRSQNHAFHWGGGDYGADEGNADDVTRRRRGATRTVTTGAPHIFVIVSALTTKAETGSSSSPTLGDAIRSLSGVDARATHSQSSPRDDLYGENRWPSSAAVNQMHLNAPPYRGGAGTMDSGSPEELVYSMAVWLIANNVIVEVKDYLVAIEPSLDLNNGSKPESCQESLYHELLRSGCLEGTAPIAEICYEFGIDQTRMETFIQWGLQTQPKRLEVLSGP
ncbi:hypothetical protein ACHAW5_010918 [Stephanodiscus triporus]|uniref:Uncharacterized protein n=1 Tax=Stephanodiscus triporus TaxID=2934178 RepID=A0ABD3PBB2_9STRA